MQVAGVSKLVEIDDGLVAFSQPVQNKVTSDETSAAGNKNGHIHTFLKIAATANPTLPNKV